MNDLALQIKYKGIAKHTAVVCCTAWLALSFAFFFLCAATVSVFQVPWFVVLCTWLVGGCLFVYVPFQIVSSYCEGGVLVVNGDGLVLPRGMFGFGPQRSIKWSQLKSIDCTRHEQPVLAFKSAGRFPVKVHTASISKDELDQLIHAVELWSPQVFWSGRATDFKNRLQDSDTTGSFTRLWEEELRRRYSVTTFTPHEPGLKLRSGAYTISKQLAFGGFSAVYLAESQDREKVVIKQLVASNCSPDLQQKSLEMFHREAEILSRLHHDSIARVIDFFVEQDINYLVLEHVDGENLRELVHRRGALSCDETTRLAVQMLSILEYLHGLNPPLVHRDFTPDNLILKANGQLMLVDFGSTTEYIRSATGTLVGKQCYMPLEQIRGKSEPATDLFALGGTLHFLLTAKDPEPLSVCSGSGELAHVIQRLTQAEPGLRFSSASEVKYLLNQYTCVEG